MWWWTPYLIKRRGVERERERQQNLVRRKRREEKRRERTISRYRNELQWKKQTRVEIVTWCWCCFRYLNISCQSPLSHCISTICSSRMRRADASNQPDGNYEYSKQRGGTRHVIPDLERNRCSRTIRPAMASSIVSISIRAILRSFSKNLNRLIVPYWEKIVRISSSFVSVLHKRLSRSSVEDQRRRLTEYSRDAKHCPVEKYCCSSLIRASWIDAVENWWSLWLNPYPRWEWSSVLISISSSSYGCSIFGHLNELMFGERHSNGFAKHGDMIEILMS